VDDRLRKLQRQAQTSGDPDTVWKYIGLLERLVGEGDIKLKLWMVKFTHYDRSDLSWNDGMYLTKTLAAKSACNDILEFSAEWIDCDESQALHDARKALYDAGKYEELLDNYHETGADDTFELVEMDVR
jgi:hypothetical protein